MRNIFCKICDRYLGTGPIDVLIICDECTDEVRKKTVICSCNTEHNAKYQDPITKMHHTKECIKQEIQWLKKFKNLNDSNSTWNRIMTWNERIKQLQNVIGE